MAEVTSAFFTGATLHAIVRVPRGLVEAGRHELAFRFQYRSTELGDGGWFEPPAVPVSSDWPATNGYAEGQVSFANAPPPIFDPTNTVEMNACVKAYPSGRAAGAPEQCRMLTAPNLS